MRLSIGIPVFNEEAVLPELLDRLRRVLDGIPGGPHEVVFVDDGSTDGTLPLLEAAVARDPRVRVIVLSRNFGHQAALGAAMDHATGDVLVMMDADLQDEPEVIPQFLAHHAAGAQVVYARRVDRKEGVLLRLAYRLFYRSLSAVSATRLPLDSGDFALLDRSVVEAIKGLPERQRYLRGLRAWVGFKQVGVDVERQRRSAGRAKYTTLRLLKLALDGLCAFSVLPLRAAALVGVLAIFLSLAFSSYAVYAKLVHGSPQGFTAILLVITFLAGVQLLFLGVIGEYVGRVYEEAKARPAYVVARVVADGGGAEVAGWILSMRSSTPRCTVSTGGGGPEND
jgi:glycosyltransferase involved in cell wall biosynthesis